MRFFRILPEMYARSSVFCSLASRTLNIAFGSVTGTRGLFIRNNSGTSIELFVNNPAATSGSAGGFQLHAGGILLVCATTAGGAVVGPIASLKAFMIAAPSSSGTIDYIVLGD